MPQFDEFGGIISAETEEPQRDEFGGVIAGGARRRQGLTPTGEPDPTGIPGVPDQPTPEPSDEETARMFGREAAGFWSSFGHEFTHPFKSTAKGVGIPVLDEDTLKKHLVSVFHEQNKELPPTTGGKIGGFLGGAAGTITQAGLTHLAAGRLGPVGAKLALGATFGSAAAYDEFIRAGTAALREGKTEDEAVTIAERSAAAAAPAGGALGVVTPPGFGPGAKLTLRKALTAGGVMGGLGAALPFYENVIQRLQGLQTPLTEGVVQGGLTMGALPPGLYGAGKLLGLVPRALGALRSEPTRTTTKTATGKTTVETGGEAAPMPERPRAVEFEYTVGDQVVELLETDNKSGRSLVRMPDGTTRSVNAEQLEVRRKEEYALPEQETGEDVRGVSEQSEFDEGQMSPEGGAGGVPQRNVPSGGQAQGAQGQVSLRERYPVGTELEYDTPSGRKKGKVRAYTPGGRLIMDAGEDFPDYIDPPDMRRPATQPTPTIELQRPEALTPEQQASYNEQIDNLIRIVKEAQAKGAKTPKDVYGAPQAEPGTPMAAAVAEATQKIRGLLTVLADDNRRMGLPSRFRFADNVPEKYSRRLAWTTPDGEIMLNWNAVIDYLTKTDSPRRYRTLRALFSEEGIHSLARRLFNDEELAQVWRGLTGIERAIVRKSYAEIWRGNKTPSGQVFSDAQFGHEYIRRILQRALHGETTERAEGIAPISQFALDMVERLIQTLRRTFSRESPELREMITKLERFTAAAKHVGTTELPAAKGETPFAFRRRLEGESEEQYNRAKVRYRETNFTSQLLHEDIVDTLEDHPEFSQRIFDTLKKFGVDPLEEQTDLANELGIWLDYTLKKRRSGGKNHLNPDTIKLVEDVLRTNPDLERRWRNREAADLLAHRRGGGAEPEGEGGGEIPMGIPIDWDKVIESETLQHKIAGKPRKEEWMPGPPPEEGASDWVHPWKTARGKAELIKKFGQDVDIFKEDVGFNKKWDEFADAFKAADKQVPDNLQPYAGPEGFELYHTTTSKQSLVRMYLAGQQPNAAELAYINKLFEINPDLKRLAGRVTHQGAYINHLLEMSGVDRDTIDEVLNEPWFASGQKHGMRRNIYDQNPALAYELDKFFAQRHGRELPQAPDADTLLAYRRGGGDDRDFVAGVVRDIIEGKYPYHKPTRNQKMIHDWLAFKVTNEMLAQGVKRPTEEIKDRIRREIAQQIQDGWFDKELDIREAPLAYRRGKRPPPQEQEGLNLLPSAGGPGATMSELGPDITPAKITEAISANVSEDRPAFSKFVQNLRLEYPGISTEQIRSLLGEWQTALGQKLLGAPGKVLEDLRKDLELQEHVKKQQAIADPVGMEVGPSKKVANALRKATHMEQKAAELEAKAEARRREFSPSEGMARDAARLTREAMTRAEELGEERVQELRNEAAGLRQRIAQAEEGLPPMERMMAQAESRVNASAALMARAAKLRERAAKLARAAREGDFGPERPQLGSLTSPAQRVRAMWIGRIHEALAKEAVNFFGEGKGLRRTSVTPEDIGWSKETKATEPALRRISDAEARPSNISNLGRILTSGAGSDRTARIGGKRVPETATKRLTVLVDTETGEVHKVGTFKTKEGWRIVDPTAPSGESTSLARLLSIKSREGGPPRYKPVLSILLDSPVKNFRQRYPAWKAFREEFLETAERDEMQRRQSAEEAAALEVAHENLTEEQKKKLGIPPKHPGMVLAGDRPTRPEAEALLRHLYAEAKRVESPQDVHDAMASLNQKAAAGTLRPADWQVINALRKEVLRTERNNPELRGKDEAINKTAERLFEDVKASESGQDFASKLGAIERSIQGGGEAEPTPGPGARELELAPGQQEAAEAVRAYHTRIAQHGIFPEETGPPPVPPEGMTSGQQVKLAQSREPLDAWLNATRKLSPSSYLEQPDPNAPLAFRRLRPERAVNDAFRFLSEWMVPRLVRVAQETGTRTGGYFTRLYGRQFNRMISRTHALYGDLSRWLDPAKQAAGGGLVGRDLAEKIRAAIDAPREVLNNWRAAMWANNVQRVRGAPRTAVSNYQEAMEGRIRAPSYADKAMTLWQEANFYIGEMLETVIPNFLASGAVQRNLTAFGMDVIRRGAGRVWEDWTAGLAQVSGRPVSEVRNFFTRWKVALDRAGQDPARAERMNQDFVRRFRRVVTHVMVDDMVGGHWEPVIHSTPFNYLEAAAQRAAHLRAFREEFPVTTATGNRNWQRAYTRIQSELPSQFHPDLDALTRALNGHPTDTYHDFFKGSLAPDSSLGNTLRTVNQIMGHLGSKLVLTGQIPTQIPETVVGATPSLLGARNYVEGLRRINGLKEQMEINGQFNALMHDWVYNPTQPVRSIARIVGNLIGKASAQNWMNELQEKAAASTATVVRERIEAGVMSPREAARIQQVFRAMQFTGDEARMMMRPSADPRIQAQRAELLGQFERKAASWLTSGNKAIAEGSRLGSNRLVNSLVRFQSYPMMKLNQFRRIFGQANETWRDPSATGAERAAAARLAGRFLLGTSLQGALAAGVTSLFYENVFGLKTQSHEAADNKGAFILESALAAMGGPLYLAYRAGFKGGPTSGLEQVARTVFPYSVATSLWDFAHGGGIYKNVDPMDRVELFLERRVPGTRMIRTGMAVFGLGNPSDKLKTSLRAFYRWRGEELGWSKTEAELKYDTAEDFRTEMKKAVQALQEGDRETYREALHAAANAHREAKTKGVRATTFFGIPKWWQEPHKLKSTATAAQAIARSFRARRVLEDVDGRPLDRHEIQSLKNRIGEDAFQQLRHYDRMLSAAADGIQLRPLP